MTNQYYIQDMLHSFQAAATTGVATELQLAVYCTQNKRQAYNFTHIPAAESVTSCQLCQNYHFSIVLIYSVSAAAH